MVTSDLIGSNGLTDLDALIEMDKNGCPAEYPVYSASHDNLLDDMVAGAGAGTNTAGVAASGLSTTTETWL